jgi:hypothetical protein
MVVALYLCCVVWVLCEEVVYIWFKHFAVISLSFQTAGTVDPYLTLQCHHLCTVQSLNPLMYQTPCTVLNGCIVNLKLLCFAQ